MVATSAGAQERFVEEPDATRLDVERLPPEAIAVTRDLYHHGLFLETHLGARGFIGGVGNLSDPGLFMSAGLGYELTSWLWFMVKAEASIHKTNAPRPPDTSGFEVVGFLGELRFQINMTARSALWIGAEFGTSFVTSEVLRTYGLRDAADFGLVYGGQLGFDWHMRNAHHSVGFLGGARLFPNLELNGEQAIGVHGTLYLRYVF